jgi:hypothetical protein
VRSVDGEEIELAAYVHFAFDRGCSRAWWSGARRLLSRRGASIARLSEALKEMGVRLMLAEGKGVGTEWPGPAPAIKAAC